MPLWHRLVIAGVVVVVTLLVARVIDRRIARHPLPPEAVTRYRVLRRALTTTIIAIGLLSALLVIPQVRAIAGGILASSAVIGLVIGFASQRTIGNVVAGLLIALTQPLRLGDEVEVAGVEGTVEEIGLTYTFIRTETNARLVIPNEKLASDTIRNSSIVTRETLAEVTVQVPLESDLGAVIALLREAAGDQPGSDVRVTALDGNATVAVRAWAPDESAADALESELRLRAHSRLRAAGVF